MKKHLQNAFFNGKVIIVTGPRQTGKTTLLEKLREENHATSLWLNCDDPDVKLMLQNVTLAQLKELIGNNLFVFIDEAQRAKNMGLALKLIVDNFKHVQVIVTGSSVLGLTNEISEPLTGRKWEYHLLPLSTAEMAGHTSRMEEEGLLEHRIIYGFYPDIIKNPENARKLLTGLSNDYLSKDLVSLETIRKPAILEKLLLELAFKIGYEISVPELAQTVGADYRTVEHYIYLLEKCFIIFELHDFAFSHKANNEIHKTRKIYFYDTGIRNAIIKNFTPVDFRQDIDALWENFLMSERRKANINAGNFVNSYFSRKDIDLIEEVAGVFHLNEFKWDKRPRFKQPGFGLFENLYPNSQIREVNKANYLDFLI